MIVTFKTRTKEGFLKVEIKPVIGERYFREFSAEALTQFLLDAESYCEWKGYDFKFIIPNHVRKLCQNMIESLIKQE